MLSEANELIEKMMNNSELPENIKDNLKKLQFLITPNEIELDANLPQIIKIGEKEFPIVDNSALVTTLINKRVQKINQLLGIDPEKYKNSSFQDYIKGMLMSIYSAIENKNAEIFELTVQMIYMYINNKPITDEGYEVEYENDMAHVNMKKTKVWKGRTSKITMDEIKADISYKNIMPVLWRVIQRSDMLNFLYANQQITKIQGN